MELVEIWMGILAKSWDNPDSLARILREAPGYLQSLHESEKAAALEEILSRTRGLFEFFDKVEDRDESFEDALIEALRSLQLIINIGANYYKAYTDKTMYICCQVLERCGLVHIELMASKTLKSLITTVEISSDKFCEILHHSEDIRYFIAIGAIAKQYPQVIKNQSDSLNTGFVYCETLFTKLLNFLECECQKTTKEIKNGNIHIFLESFSDLMKHFRPSSEEYFKDLLRLFYKLCTEHQAEEVINGVVRVVISYMQFFSAFLYADYIRWHNVFRKNYKEKSNYFWINVLQTFYKYMSLHMSQEDKPNLKGVKHYLARKLKQNSSCLFFNELGLNIYGLGQFSSLNRKYCPTEIQKLSEFILNKTLIYFTKNNGLKDIEQLPYYVQSLATVMVETTKVTSQQLDCLINLSVLIFKNYPNLNEEAQINAIQSLEATAVNVLKLDKKSQNKYFFSLFQKGILITCANALYLDVQLQREIEKILKPISYKSYLALWISLLTVVDKNNDELHEIFEKFVSVLKFLMESFNLRISHNKPDDEEHFRIFLNLIDLLTNIYEGINITVLEVSSEMLLLYFIKYSYQFPMLSGFYKLIKAIFRKLDIAYHYEDTFGKFGQELISKFLLDVVHLIPEYSGELQLSCICLILNAPIFFVKDIVDDAVPILELALTVNLNNINMAFMTLDVTEVWCNYFGQKSLTDFYENIVFYLEPYLTNTRKLHIDNKDLENLQKRILLHMGLSEFNKIQDLIYINSLSTNAKWDKKSQLSCRILFSGQQVKLTLENLIAKTLELTKSENRRVKFSACELLHTFVIIIVGNDYPRKNQSLHCLNRNLCFEILKLSCDPDDAVRNLIHPLVIQLTHYLSTKSLINHIVSRNFVDLLFEGMLEESSLNLHVYCGICLKEFVKSTSSTETNKITNFMNGLIQRIQNFALHPTNSKRIAAARAFNCLYSFALNSNVSLINIYWLQFLYVFVKCMEHSSHPQIISAVENIVSTIKEKANVLNGKNKGKRKVPAEFTSETLKGAVIWLLGQCGSDNIKCRYKCMELFENLCPIVPEYKSIQEFFNVHGISFVNDFALKGLDNCERITIENASAFFKTLDFFIWIFNKKIFSPESVLMVDNEDGKNIFFEFYSKFVSIIVNEEIDDIIKGATNSATRSDTLKDLINRIIMKIFRFVQVIVSVKDNESSALLDRLWTKDLCTFVSFFTLYPARIGLFAKTLQGITPKQLENWFLTAVKKLPEKCLVKLQTELLVKRDDFFIKFMEFDEISNEKLDITSFQYFVRGITILQKCNVYNYSNKMEITDSLLINKINIIFEVVETNCSNSCISKDFKSQIKNYVVDVLYFLLLEYNPVVVDCLVRKITPRDDSKHNTSSKSLTVSTCYNSFVEAIKVPIFQFFLIQPADTLQQMEGLLTNGISLNGFFRMIEDLLSFAQQNPSAMSKRLVDDLIRNCNKYRELIGNDEQLKDRLLDVYSIAVLLKSSEDISTPDDEVTSDLYLFIMDELKNSQDLQKKISILNRFFVYMVEHSSRIDTDLKTPLFELCDKDSVSWIQKLEDDEVERSRATQCLRCLMDLLSITGASVVLEIIIIYIAGAGKFFKQEKLDQALQAYFASLSSESALVALESIFEVFIIKSLSWDERLDVLQFILLPSLEFAAIPMISNFYNRNIYKISSSLFDTIEETDPHERKQIIVTKIGYFKLTELALSRFHFDSLTVDFNGTDNMTKIFFLPSNSQDEELVRHLNCCILNSLISAIDLQIDCKPLFLIQTIFQRLDVNSWEQIIDCKRHYDMSIPPQTFSKRAISIRPKIADENDINKEILDSLLDQYFSPIPVDPDYLRYARNGRQSLTLENDDLNDHECMPMLTGLWMYLFNKKVLRKPPEEATEKKFEVWMNCLSTGLTPKKDNLTLFILRLFSNAKKIFLPFLSSLFSDIAKALSSYLTNNPINYLVRDMLIMFIESEFIPGEDNENEEEDAQTLVEKLIDEALDENPKIYIYNISLIEALVKAWNSKLKIFRNLEKIININKDLSMCVILMMFRHNVRCEELIKLNFMHKFVREQFFRWRVPMIEKTYETIGFILKFVSNEDRYNFVKNDLVEILVDMVNTLPHHTYETGRDCCIRQLYLIFKNCPCIVDYPMLRQFMIPKTVYNDQRKVECIEMLLGVLRSCDVESIDDTLKLLNIVSVLNGRFLLCLDVAFEVVKTVIKKLPAEESKPYLLALEQYTNNDTLLRHRKVVYQIFMDAYDKYANEQVSRSEGVEESLNFSRKVLINGISDLSDDIQNFILDFWKNRTNLPSDLMDRLLHLLKMFDLDVAPSYAQFLSSLLLELARESDKDSKVLFTGLSEQDHPMLDYEIATPSLRLYSSKNRIPLYAPALARTLELAIGIQDNDFDNINASMQESCATGNLSRALVDKLTRSNDLCQKSGEDSLKESLSKRYYSEEITESSISVEYYSTVKKEISEQNESVKVNRTYKLSRVPNVEITQTDVIVTLQDLVLRDRYFAGNLVVPLVCAIVRHFTNTEMYDTLTDSVAEICSRALQIRNDFAPMAMEILHRIGSLNFNATCVADTAKSMNLQLSGILLLERNSITCDQSVYDVKKLINPKIQHNMELVSMYQSIGERDVVQSIFKNWTNSLNSSDLYQGYLAEGTSNWVKVKTIYEGTAEDDPAKDFCEQSMYRSLSELSNWDNLNSKVKASLDVYDIWNHPKKEELLPWMFMSELQMMLEDLQKNIEPETQFFQDALAQVASGNTELRRVFGEELSVYHLCNDRQSIPASLQCLNNCMDYVKEQWIDSDPLVEYSKLQLFAKLGRLSDTDSHIITMSMSDLASSVDNLIEYWNNKFPESRVGLLSWNVRVAARLGIARVAINKLSNVSMNSGVEATLLAASIQERLKISELALEYGNKKLLQKHTKEIENTLNYLNADEGRYLELRQKFEYTAARYKFLCAKDENCAKRKFYYYVDSWALANGVANEEMVDLSLRIKAKVQVAQVVRALSVTMQQDPRYLQLALAEDFVMSSLNVQDPNEIESKLKAHYFELLKGMCNEGSDKERGDNLVVLADYCHQLLMGTYHRTSEVQLEYTNAVLTAMSYGSIKATRFFPDLIKYENYSEDSNLVEFFAEKCRSVPTSMFLHLYKEILSHLGTKFHDIRDKLILPIVERLVNDFPSTIMYKFKEMWSTNAVLRNPELRNLELQKPDTKKKSELRKNLREEQLRTDKIINMYKTVCSEQMDKFFSAIEYLCQPEEYMKFYLSEIIRNGRSTASFIKLLKTLIGKIQMNNDLNLRGSMFQQLLSNYSEQLQEWVTITDLKTLQTIAKNLCVDLRINMQARLKNDKSFNPILLQSYSSFLAEFQFDKHKIEVPGLQNQSVPSHRVFIAKIDLNVEIVLVSKRYCLKVNIIGTDGKTYEYLIKFGTDMRQDERMQQLFESINQSLSSDSRCIERHLFAHTYNIIPINTYLGLVQWVKEAKSLRDFVEFTMTDKTILNEISMKYQEWIMQANDENSNVKSKCYKQALLKYSPDEVEAKIKELTGLLDWDLLRKTFVKITSSIESFFKLRQNFILSYAVMCTVDWIAGIGDRRLDNILIEVSTGKCFGIDHKMVFGTGIDQPVPELVPFRLTSQIMGLLRPFTPKDLFGASMSHVLAAMRNEKNLILIYLNMLLLEDLKWDHLVEERWLQDCNHYDGEWLPKFKLEIAQKKLNGEKPSLIMINELSSNHNNHENQYFSINKCILRGNEFKHDNIRAHIKDCNLTPEEQMLCLVDQATDVNILGRICVEWYPFV